MSSDTTPPVNAITLSAVTGNAVKSGDTIYYRGVASGSFTLTNAVTDSESGPASSATAGLTGTTTRWTHSPSTVSSPAGGAYVSTLFSWTAGATSAPTELVTGRDVAGNTATTTLSFVNDSTPPGASTITYAHGHQVARAVNITLTFGTDSGSGIATRWLQRSSALVTGGRTCGSFGGFANLTADPASTYPDSTVKNGNCYQYRYVVTDRAGNRSTATSPNVAKVDYANAVLATTGLLSYWRLGESAATLIASDAFSAGSGPADLPHHAAEIGGTWAYLCGSSNNERISSENRAYRSRNGYSIYYLPPTPASRNYSVEADLFYRGTLAKDTAGVIGRLDTTSKSFYMARWEKNNTWNIVKWSHGAPVKTDKVGLHFDNFQVTPATYPRAADSKGNNTGDYVNGVTIGAPGALPGDANTAARLDGINDYVQAAGATGIPVGASARRRHLDHALHRRRRPTVAGCDLGHRDERLEQFRHRRHKQSRRRRLWWELPRLARRGRPLCDGS